MERDLIIKNVSKSFGKDTILKDVSLNIVPVRLKYNDDFTEINKGFVDSIWHIDASDFSKYDSTAKLFISQKSQFESLTPESLKDVDGQL